MATSPQTQEQGARPTVPPEARTALITILAGVISAGATIGVAYLGGFFNVANTREASAGSINLEKLKFNNELIKNALSANNPANSLLFYANIGLLDDVTAEKVRVYVKQEADRLKKGDAGASLLPNFDKSARPTLWLDQQFFLSFAPRARPEYVNGLVATGNYLLLGFGINASAKRLSAFLSYIAYDTDGFVETVENGNYSKDRLIKVFPTFFNDQNVAEFANNQQKIFNLIYANRLGNGDQASGDGYRFRGRGYLQLTGRTAYENYTNEIGVDLVNNPDLMADPNVSLLVAALYWTKNGFNELADQDRLADIVKTVTGSTNNLPQYQALADRALKLLNAKNTALAQ